WSRKGLIRLIVTSATYRQSSNARPELQTIDPLNTLLARQSRLRLPAELIRDSALSVSGLLSAKVGGPSVRPPQPEGVGELGYNSGRGDSAWKESAGEDRYRRGLYTHFQRTTPHPQLMNFDAPRASVTACRRERSNTSLQALNLLNDTAFFEAAQALGYRTVTEPTANFDARLRFVFMETLSREPDEKESARLRSYFDRQREILTRENKDSERAAWSMLASVLLNLDEFITRE